MTKILDRYILRELTIAFMLSIAVLLSAFLMQQMMKFSRLSADTGISFFGLVKFAPFIIPLFLVLAIPLSVLISSILTFSRLSTDHEITAMRSAGISLYRMLPPVLIFSLIAFLLALLSSTVLQPMGNRYIRLQSYEALKSERNLGLQEGVFNNLFNLLVYVKKVEEADTLNDVLISDRSSKDSKIITARRGKFLNDPSTANIFLKLENGRIYFELEDRERYQMASFSTYYIRLDAANSIERVRLFKDVWGIGLGELRKKMKEDLDQGKYREYRRAMIEFHKKFSLPAAALVLGILGAPVGILSKFSSRFAGFIVSIAIVFCYYVIDSGFEILAVEGFIHPFWAAWATVAVSLMLAGFSIAVVARK
ncbi:MAG: LptF/LptG family permease [Nitrospirae bacterium]|nr:LptF/LptG family permease [Nitrospirota bacterium]